MSEMPSEAPAVSGRRRWKGRLTSLVAVCVIIATVAAVQTLRSSGDRANKAKAQAEITHLLASFETPPGSIRIAKPDLAVLDNTAIGTLTSDHFIDAVQYWRFPIAPVET